MEVAECIFSGDIELRGRRNGEDGIGCCDGEDDVTIHDVFDGTRCYFCL